MDRSVVTVMSLAAGTALAVPTAKAQLRVCTWNVTNYTATSTARNGAFQTAFYGQVPAGLTLSGKSMSPDVIIAQELTSATAVTNFRTMLNTAPGSPGDWAAAPFLNGNDTDNAFFYRTGKVQYLGRWRVSVGGADPAPPRDTIRYDFRPVGYTAPGASIGGYSVHMMSQGGAPARRTLESQRIRDNAQGVDTNPGDSANPAGTSALPAGYAFLMGGDTNMQSSTDGGWIALTGSESNNTGRFFDPIRTPGSWNNASGFRFVHTQDPRQTGMDDRFDVILVGGSLVDGAGLEYIGNSNVTYSTLTWNDTNHSYRCWGNDGGSYGVALRTTGNTMVGPVIAQALIDSTNDGGSSGGHLPIIMDLKVPAEVALSTSSLSFGQAAQGEVVTLPIEVRNDGNTALWTAAGIANLRYTVTVSGPFTVTLAGVQQTDAPGGAGVSHTVTMSTAALGPKTGSMTITTDAPDSPVLVVPLSGEVVVAACGPADLGGQGGQTGPDGLLDNNDFVVFIDLFFATNTAADLGSQGGVPGSDGLFDNNDFVAFIDAFFAGC